MKPGILMDWKQQKNGLTRCPTDKPDEQKDCTHYEPKDSARDKWICDHFREINGDLWWCDHLESKEDE